MAAAKAAKMKAKVDEAPKKPQRMLHPVSDEVMASYLEFQATSVFGRRRLEEEKKKKLQK